MKKYIILRVPQYLHADCMMYDDGALIAVGVRYLITTINT